MNDSPLGAFSKLLIGVGFFLIVLGLFTYAASRVPRIGRLPGDFLIQKGNFSFYFPLATSLIVSLILTVLINLFRKS